MKEICGTPVSPTFTHTTTTTTQAPESTTINMFCDNQFFIGFRDLFETMNHFYNSTLQVDNCPPYNIIETPSEYIIELSIPGFYPDHLRVSTVGDMLTVEGYLPDSEKASCSEPAFDHSVDEYQGFVQMPFSVSFRVHNAEVSLTKLVNGVLTITFDKNIVAVREVPINVIPIESSRDLHEGTKIHPSHPSTHNTDSYLKLESMR